MQNKLLLASRNQNKKRELQEILKGMKLDVLTLDEINSIPEVEEDGNSFVENAIKKAVETAAKSALVCLADDSGLVVDALNGQPGIYSARYAGPDANDSKNNDKLLSMMKDIEAGHRTARFVCVIAISDKDGNVETVEGSCPGRIAFSPVGSGGFGYDPLFIPDGFEKSFAQLSAEEKNRISHRGKAIQKARPLIEKYCCQG